MAAYYNENNPFVAQWLRNLICAGHIAPGVVDTRSIEDVRPEELNEFTQCHFFAGIGVWSYALRLAGWPDNRRIWTASCPCQPFSQAGAGAGLNDKRHLWPHLHWLIEQCRPGAIFGEQVASIDGMAWLDLVQSDLEGARYTSGAIDLCSAGFGAPHIRQRLYWMAYANGQRSGAGLPAEKRHELADSGRYGGLELSGSHGRKRRLLGRQGPQRKAIDRPTGCDGAAYRTLQVNDFWRDADWLGCRDGFWRPVEPGTLPLVNGLAGRVGRCSAYGNSITVQVAEAFIGAALEVDLQC